MVCNVGSPMTGKKADERKSIGMMIRFMIRGKDWKSFILEAIISPKPTAVIAIEIMKNMVRIIPINPEMGMPNMIDIARIKNPCNNAIVAPPKVRPRIIEKRLMGATNTS